MRKILIFIPLLLCLLSSVFAQIPSGYYDAANGLSGDSLRTALKTIIKTGHVKLFYTPDVWNAYAYTDIKPSTNNNIIWDMYTDIPGGTSITTLTIFTGQCGSGGASAEGLCYSREHCFPNSWWGHFDDSTHEQYSDLHHLFPSDQYVNLHKSNNLPGQTNAPTYTSNNGSKVGPSSVPGFTGTVFEPIDAYKGDFARAYLYMATRYMDSIGAWVKNYPNYESRFIIDTITNNYKQWFIDMLLNWHTNDAVSSKEINRNNAIYYNTAQHNRNPFVDHPEYVQAIWGGSLIIKQEPTNPATNFQAINTAPLNTTITVSWTDATGGVLPDGYLIRASSVGFSQIQHPTDSIAEINTILQKVVGSGVQTSVFTSLTPNTLYYFKIFPYTNNGNNINYKIDGIIPSAVDSTSVSVWKEDFETGSKTTYASNTVNCTMGNWTFSDALIGTSASDKKNGLKSARLRNANLTMNFDKANGGDTVVIYHAKYGNDLNTTWRLQLSSDGGISWNYVGNPVTSSDSLSPAVFVINQQGNLRLNIETTSTTLRVNIDDIMISDYHAPATFISANAALNPVINIYAYCKDIYINSSEKIKEICIYNLLGQPIIQKTILNKTMYTVHLENVAAYYIVKIITDKNVYTKKIFIE